jgi:predicted glycosyltransferase
MKVAIYYNHYDTLGHSTRVLGIIRAIRRVIPRSRVLVLESGRTAELLGMEQDARVVRLPYVPGKKGLLVERMPGLYARAKGSLLLEKMRVARLRLVLKEVAGFRPDVFMAENSPFGQEFWTFELSQMIDEVRAECGCRIVGSCGYLGFSETLGQDLEDRYDQVLVHTPRALALEQLKSFKRQTAAAVIRAVERYAAKIRFTGFILDAAGRPGSHRVWKPGLVSAGCGRVFVSRGGGIVNSLLVVSALLAARKMERHAFVICSGPATSSQEWKEYRRLAKGARNVRLVRALSPAEFDRQMAAADVCVSMSGYNTCLRLLFLKKRAVLVPFATEEQRGRAEIMPRYLPVRVLSGPELGVAALCSSIEEAEMLPWPSARIPASWFDGGQETAEALRCLC